MRRIILIFLLLILFALPVPFVFSQPLTPTPPPIQNSRLEELQKEITDLQNKIKDAQGKIKTLSSQVAVMNNQIRLTELKINQAKAELVELEQDIDLLQEKIAKLELSLDELSSVLLQRIIATYKVGAIEPWQLIVSSSGFSDLLSRIQYIRIAQVKAKKLTYDTEQTKVDYTNQKDIFEKKQQQLETLRKQLENYTSQLTQQKRDRESLLEITRGDEKTFQEQLARVRAERAAILGIVQGKGQETLVGSIKVGESVGSVVVGKSACSTGTHLHFEVVKNDSQQDPTNYLKNVPLTFEQNVRQFTPTGSWEWPLDEPIKINQEFGQTAWSNQYYQGGPHTGIDMFRKDVDLFSSVDVKAVKDGKFYRGSIACGGGTLLYARVDHSDNLQTYYLHIVPK